MTVPSSSVPRSSVWPSACLCTEGSYCSRGSRTRSGDSRTPAVASLAVAILGGVGMLAAAAGPPRGPTRLVLVGLAHIGRLRHRCDRPGAPPPRPRRLRVAPGPAATRRCRGCSRAGRPGSAMEAWAPDGGGHHAARHRRARGAWRSPATRRRCGSSARCHRARPWRRGPPPREPRAGDRGRLLVVLAVLASAPPSAAAGAGAHRSGAGGVAAGPSWDELYQGDTPIARRAAGRVGRGRHVGAGRRPAHDARRRLRRDQRRARRARGVRPSGEVLEADEDFYGAPARGPVRGAHGGAGDRTACWRWRFPALVERNEDLDYGAEIGALGEALDGRRRAARRHRQRRRRRATSRVRPTTAPPASPWWTSGRWSPPGRSAASCSTPIRRLPTACAWRTTRWPTPSTASWAQGGVVLVEGSDLERADRYTGRRADGRRPKHGATALRSTDDLVAELLGRSTRPATRSWSWRPYHRRGAGPPHGGGAARRRTWSPGCCGPGRTRRTGIVTLVDIAPTILDLVGVDRPSSMEGRRFERVATAPSTGEARADRPGRARRGQRATATGW